MGPHVPLDFQFLAHLTLIPSSSPELEAQLSFTVTWLLFTYTPVPGNPSPLLFPPFIAIHGASYVVSIYISYSLEPSAGGALLPEEKEPHCVQDYTPAFVHTLLLFPSLRLPLHKFQSGRHKHGGPLQLPFSVSSI